ncbi:predicted protein [Naegleria gruberi]|uniref:Predicted protein n=1 Tax=Naegleria gruberi TaxID=5762 RepID=D2V8N8_NAEGR|nr:uncharacterized protein NAEGRDRAFT_65224 [Naegleria gruberi]EFC46724.1 predicted protein [Naegleria gruberi]|eukprot:XP_002679468.1 predicted protein [Naegleria gruberi strain NEG-M]
MVDYLIYQHRNHLPYSEVDVFFCSDVNAYNSPVWFLCERAQLHIFQFSKQLSWWRCSYLLSLVMIPHLIPGFFLRGRFMNKPKPKLEESPVTRKDVKFYLRLAVKYLKDFLFQLFALPHLERKKARILFNESESYGFFSFILATLFSTLCVFIGRCIVNEAYRKRPILVKERNYFQLVPYQIEEIEEHTLILSFLYLDIIVAAVFSLIFPVSKFVLHNMTSFLIRKKFLIFRKFELATLYLCPVTIITGTPIMSPFIGSFYAAESKYNYQYEKNKKTAVLVRLPFLLLLYSVMIMNIIPQLLIRYQGVVLLRETIQDDWFIWFSYLGYYCAFYTFFESVCYIPGSFCYHAFKKSIWLGCFIVTIGVILEVAFFFGLQRWL